LYDVVARVTREVEDLEPSLEQLEAADLIHARGVAPDLEYVFKHALTQEVAYDGLLKSERAALHERAAFAMEQILRDRIPEFVETLAYHFTRGGVVDKAVHYLRESGKKCVERYAIAAAAAHYQSAYDLLTSCERTPAQDRALIELLCEWSLVHYYQGDCTHWRPLLEAHLELAATLGDAGLHGMYLGWTGHMLFWHLELDRSLECLDRASRLAETGGQQARARLRRDLASLDARDHGSPRRGRGRGRARRGAGAAVSGRAVPALQAAGGDRAERGDLGRPRARAARGPGAARDRRAHRELARAGAGSLRARAPPQQRARARPRPRGRAGRARRRPGSRVSSFSTVALAQALSGADRPEEALRSLAEVMPEAERLSQEIVVRIFRGFQASGRMGAGEPARGMRALEALRAEPAAGWIDLLPDWSTALASARIARREGSLALSGLLRNLGFVIRYALPARRRARALLERFADPTDERFAGAAGLANLELARLHAYAREHDAARSRAARAVDFYERRGAHHAAAIARELRDSG
jgi:hypothetical protein